MRAALFSLQALNENLSPEGEKPLGYRGLLEISIWCDLPFDLLKGYYTKTHGGLKGLWGTPSLQVVSTQAPDGKIIIYPVPPRILLELLPKEISSKLTYFEGPILKDGLHTGGILKISEGKTFTPMPVCPRSLLSEFSSQWVFLKGEIAKVFSMRKPFRLRGRSFDLLLQSANSQSKKEKVSE